jgi:hypothetical protein
MVTLGLVPSPGTFRVWFFFSVIWLYILDL